jgi:allophanate hydrolase subunit 1
MTTRERYDAALQAFREAARAHTTVTLKFRAKEVDDAAFLASLARQNEASRAMDEAEAALLAKNGPRK